MNISVGQFHDAHNHANSVMGWDQAYYQMSPGTLNSTLKQFTAGHVHVFRETLDQRVLQHGAAPSGRLCFALPLSTKGSARMQGRSVDDDCILVMRGGDEFMFHAPEGMEVLAVTVDRSEISENIPGMTGSHTVEALLRQPVHRVAPGKLQILREHMVHACDEVFAEPGQQPLGQGSDFLAHSLIDALLALLVSPETLREAPDAASARNYVFEKCHRIALAERAAPPTVMDLCERLHISRRTVQYSFADQVNMTPVQYLRCLRLNGVRKDLIASSSQALGIGDAAAAWGFFHLSHFASDYRELFGELPSQTERRNGSSRAKTSSAKMVM